VDVRIIAATNRTLTEEIAAGRFREDLFYCRGGPKHPALRDRVGDPVFLLIISLSSKQRGCGEPGYKNKNLSAGAKNLLLSHAWPGNVRELLNTLRRAAIWSEGSTITTEDAREAVLPAATRPGYANILGKPLGDGFRLPELLKDVASHYLGRALDEASGNKTKAANLVGLQLSNAHELAKTIRSGDGTKRA
jgi:DNA-binding NtrC family response regulator